MPYFISPKILISGEPCEIFGDEARHILLSKRCKVGEVVNVQGADGKRYKSEIIDAKKDKLIVIPKVETEVPKEPDVEVVLFQAVVAEQALDAILQKSTELRATKVVLFNSERAAAKLSQEKWKAKQSRWNKILWESAKQSERAKIPELEFVKDFNQAVEQLAHYDKIILLDPESKNNFKNLTQYFKSCQSCSIIIGPEGGFSASEAEKFKTLPQCKAVNLGPAILRADTAATAGLVIIQSLLN